MNNLKQIGLAVHNFHDVRNGLPPYIVAENKMTFWGLLLPFLDYGTIYSRVNMDMDILNAVGNNTCCDGPGGPNTAPHAFTQKSAAIPPWFCPSRRSPMLTSGITAPAIDYAVVLWYDDSGSAAHDGTGSNGGWWDTCHDSNNDNGQWQKCWGAIRPAVRPSGAPQNNTGSTNGWLPRDNFGWIQDGTSNTMMVGERHVTTLGMGRCW